MEQPEILDDCLSRMRAGESPAQCLSDYPEQADALLPLLKAAERLAVLRSAALPEATRQRAKAALRQALSDQSPRRNTRGVGGWLFGPNRARGLALAATVAVVACTAWMTTTVAASGPGDPAYSLRILAERAPAWIQTNPSARAEAELRAAQRRLADLQIVVVQSGNADREVLAALLASDEAASQTAARLAPEQRARVAAILSEHAQILQDMAQDTSGTSTAEALHRAAQRANQAAHGITPGSSETPADPSSVPAPPTTDVPAATPEPSSTTPGQTGGMPAWTPQATRLPGEIEPDMPRVGDHDRSRANTPDKRETAQPDYESHSRKWLSMPPGLSVGLQLPGTPGPVPGWLLPTHGNRPGQPVATESPRTPGPQAPHVAPLLPRSIPQPHGKGNQGNAPAPGNDKTQPLPQWPKAPGEPKPTR